jgi:AraC-like DNA-binding protein
MKNEIPVYDICSLTNFRSEDILVSRFAPYLKNHHRLVLPHRHSFYHLVLFTEGSGTHTIDFEQFPVKPFQIYFMIPGQVHSWNFEGFVDGYVLNFSSSFFQSFLLRPEFLEEFSFFNGITQDSVIDIPESLQEKIISLFEELLNGSPNRGALSFDKARVLMLYLFMLVNEVKLEDHPKPVSSYNQTLIKNFQKLIDKNHTHIRLPKEYAELLYVTPNHLNAVCSDLLGISAGELIRNRTVLEAKRLLVNLDLSISQIAYELNFSDNSYFTKFFKKQVGVTPEEFRKKVYNNQKDENINSK